MKTIIDLVLLGILVICTWNGYKKGILMGVGGILCIVAAVYGANLLANTFSHDVIPALRPFASGYTEGLLSGEDSKVMKKMGWEDYDYSVEDILGMYSERKAEFCTECFKTMGISEKTAAHMAEKTLAYAKESGQNTVSSMVQVLCESVSYVCCFTLAFLLILIILTVIGNLPNLSFKIPHLDMANDIAGAALGFLTGLMFCALLVWALKFMGMIIGGDTLSSTVLGGWLQKRDFLFKFLGI